MITPDEFMAYVLQQGRISMLEYMQWMATERDWESAKEVISPTGRPVAERTMPEDDEG